ncbi:MAG TPA: GNAT family N-acetyltransferase [Streptosporangiaceae bacterium]
MRRTQVGTQRTGNFAIRRPCISDHDGIREFLTGLSLRARYLRFFSGAPPTSGAMLRILAGGSADTDVLVATGDGVIIGHAMAGDRTGPGGTRTEIGVVVADAYRGQGVGSALVRQLVTRAQRRGATALVMEVLAENRQVLTMIADHWPVAAQERSGAYITISARLQPEVPSRPDAGSRPDSGAWPDRGSWLPDFGKETVAAGIARRTAR